MKKSSVYGCLAVVAIFFACANEPEKTGLRNIEAYYFPLGDLKEGKVYEYEPVGEEGDPPVYWYYKSEQESGRTYLVGRSYGPSFAPDQTVREEQVHNGMLLDEFYIYETDSTGEIHKIKGDIEAANVFPFEAKPLGDVLLSSMHWRPLGDTAGITLVRNRQFDGDTSVVFDGKNLPAVKFNTRELVDQEELGHLELEFGGTEVYAKSLGLVYFHKDVTTQRRIAYRLKATYTLQAFEAKHEAKLDLEN